MSIFAVLLTLAISSSLAVVDAFAPPRPLASTSSTTSSPVRFRRARHALPFPASTAFSERSSSLSSSSTRLNSLQPLVQEIVELAARNRPPGSPPPTIFVGGKGGVGKTSLSSSLAVALASYSPIDGREPLKVLIASTDPAHSLGDALDVDLRGTGGDAGPVTLSDPLTSGNLCALEIDPASALAEFRSSLEAFDVNSLASGMGLGDGAMKFLDDLGLNEMSELLRDPPPGLDELVALSNVLDAGESGRNDGYDVIVVDTAPTGHTLRMLQLPQFLDGFLGKLLKLRMKLNGLAGTIQAFMGGGGGDAGGMNPTQQVEAALEKLEAFQRRAADLRVRLRNPDQTKFMLVSAPTKLSVDESKRFLTELTGMGIRVSDVVINQCVGKISGNDDGSGSEGDSKMEAYYRRRSAGQQRWIGELKEACADVGESEEYRSNDSGGGAGIDVREVPFYDVELVGVPALGFLGGNTFAKPVADGEPGAVERYEGLLCGTNDEDTRNPKVVLCGGKGGVGKTTTSSSLAVAMANAGRNVAVVSTDPAHSLGDALGMDLRGGALIDVPFIGVPPSPLGGTGEGSLSAIEIDPAAALKEFKSAVDKLIGSDANDDDDSGPKGEMKRTLRDIGEIFDTLPAGTDEVVALAKVVNLIRKGGFDRIVIDTAPTGHTLRMLTTPAFLANLIERVLKIAKKVNSNAAIKMFVSGAVKNKEELDEAAETAKDALLKFQVSMYDLEDLFADASSTEFLIVTVPTELAVRESVRLLNDLTFGDPDMPIKVRSVVVNQVLKEVDGDDEKAGEAMRGFLSRLKRSQSSSIGDLRTAVGSMQEPPRVTEVSYLDTEPRGVYGLRALSEEYLSPEEVLST